MKMRGVIIILVSIVSLAVGGYIFLGQNSVTPTPVEKVTEPLVKNEGRYINYSKGALDKAQGKRRVLFFYASWCPICRPADTSFKENVDKIPDDVVLVRVNYNDPDTDQEEKELAEKYVVTYQHTFVQIDGSGNEVTKWSGGEIEELLEKLEFKEQQAAFGIFTNGVFRVFTAPMYHNLSQDVYIDSSNPNIIKITKPNTTWNNFFSTLPFKLSHECLTTGTKETFCTGASGKLRFYLNGVEQTTVLGQKIKQGDKLLISFGDDSADQIKKQIEAVPNPIN